MHTRRPILAAAGTATGLLLADANVEDLAAHPAFTEALATHRPKLVKSLTLDELKAHPAFASEVKAQAEAGVAAALKDLKEETIASLPAVKTYVEKKIQDGIVSSDAAKGFLAMVAEASAAHSGAGAAASQPATPEVKVSGPVHEDSVKLHQETIAVMASEKGLAYADAQIKAAEKIGYRKGGK